MLNKKDETIKFNLSQEDKKLSVNLETKNSLDLKEVTLLLSNLGKLKEVETVRVEVPKIIEKEVIKEIKIPEIVEKEVVKTELIPEKIIEKAVIVDNNKEFEKKLKNILDNSKTNKDAIISIRNLLDYPYRGI